MKQFSPSDVVALLQDITHLKQEHFLCLSLDSTRHLIACRTVFIGTLDSVLVHPREIFAGALEDHAAGIIVAHNHPSGDVTPSKNDMETTQQLIEAGRILGIPVYDHIIISKNGYLSFQTEGLM